MSLAARRQGCEWAVACFPPPLSGNPYQRLLYEHLDREGFRLVRDPAMHRGWFGFRWLWRHRRTVDVLHVHWPQGLWRRRGGNAVTRRTASWLKLAAFACRLRTARALGYVLVWTVHQVDPHESDSRRLDRRGAKLLARAAHLLVAHDEETAACARVLAGTHADRVHVVPHGNYAGAYPAGRPRTEVRAELGLPDSTFVFLCFGELRAYKGVEPLLAAFRSAGTEVATLVVAGRVVDERAAEAVHAAAAEDPRVRPMLGFVPDDRVAELFAAADAAVLAREPGTSGSLILALSQGVPAVAPATETYSALLAGGGAGWLYDATQPEALADALRRAVSDPDLAARRRLALAQMRELDWAPIAGRLAAHLRATAAGRAAHSGLTSHTPEPVR